ncbi:Transcription mediator complex subunit Med12-like protein [Elsinoe fawcettii]|nr:Transcription mediator complex subunit Med12-like protein [Elsinoe fawcettii]
MEAQSSSLDHIHLPQSGDFGNAPTGTSQSTFAFSQSQHGPSTLSREWSNASSAASAQEKSWKDVGGADDVQTQYSDSENLPDADDGNDDHSMRSASTPSDDGDTPQPHVPAPLPLPVSTRDSNNATSGSSRKRFALSELRAQGDKPPTLAIPLRPGKTADYRPWVGDAAEDVLNETIIRNGFSDKPANAGQSESNMARPIIWQNLKNKHGMVALSALFIQTMDKRQALGKCTSQSTFKPPPRVTLTDTKREAWLRDLASADVPLRRLSRTIPHGVRNKVLLDQCLSKKIPLARAIWLVKCVGANEIRAFRRKGISGPVALSGELKWIKEWTLCVIQFLDASIRITGQKDWSTNIKYVIRLVTALVDEDLLDREYFLNWTTTSFATASLDLLPIWILMVQICWRHLCRIHTRGRQLGEAILAQLDNLKSAAHSSTCKALIETLDQLLLKLAAGHPDCLIAMRRWPVLAPTVNAVRIKYGHNQAASRLHTLANRNDRLNVSSEQTRGRLKSCRLLLFDYLDQVDFASSMVVIVDECQSICTDSEMLVTAIVDWATTVYRIGQARIYLAIRILRQLAATGTSLEAPLLTCLSNTSLTCHDRHSFNQIVVELVSSSDFNFGKYLQWLISSGHVSTSQESHAALLHSIPPSCLSSQSLSLRRAIISRLDYQENEAEKSAQLVAAMDELYEKGLQASDWISLMGKAAAAPASARLALSRRLASLLVQNEEARAVVDAPTYLAARDLMEDAADFPSLYDLLRALIPLAKFQDVANFATTIQRNANVFNAMGVLQELTVLLHRVHARLRHMNQYDKIFICSLLELSRSQTRLGTQVPSLEQDLIICEQQHAAAVCSPASDSMLTVQSGEIGSDEDIDRALASGNMMEEQLLARLFSAIVERAVKWTVSGNSSLASPCRWFASLRLFDTSVFDRHMNNLLGKLVANAGTDQVRAILIALVSSGCLNPDNALNAFVKRLDLLESNNAPPLARFAVGTLQTFLPLNDLDHQRSQPEIYRYQTAQVAICKQRYKTILRFVWHGLAMQNDANNCLFSPSAVSWLSKCCVDDADAVATALHVHERIGAPKGPRVSKLLWLLAHGIDSANFTSTSEKGDMSSLARMIRGSDELRLPFIRLLIGQVGGASATPEEQADLRRAFETAIAEHSLIWPQLMGGAGSEVARSLHQHSSDAILNAVAELASDSADDNTTPTIEENLKVAAITSNDNDEYGVLIMDRVVDLLQHSSERLDQSLARGVVGDRALQSIATLTHLVILTASSLPADKATSPSTQLLLGTLSTILARGDLQMHCEVLDLVHDCCALLARPLSTDQLSSICCRLEESTRHNGRVRYLLGVEDSTPKWLALASRVPVQSLATNSPTPVQTSFHAFTRPGQQSMPSPRAFSGTASNTSTPLPSPGGQIPPGQSRTPGLVATETKYNPFIFRQWELMQDPTPNMGNNDTSLSLQLFAARKVL